METNDSKNKFLVQNLKNHLMRLSSMASCMNYVFWYLGVYNLVVYFD